jgi:hypothetical protein
MLTRKIKAAQEVRRLAARKDYRILAQCRKLVREVANELKIKNPLDSH